MTQVRRAAVLLLFISAAMVEAFRLKSLSALSNSDVWWHLSSGLWILRNHTLPHSGLFSQSASAAWIAASWGYDLLLGGAYRLLDLRALPGLLMGLKTGLAVTTFILGGGLQGKFWPAIGLSALTQYILGNVPPGPGYFSILGLGIELILIKESARTGGVRPLLWLTPLFLLWANFDVQFVYGVAVLVLFLAWLTLMEVARRTRTAWFSSELHMVPLRPAAIAGAVAILSTLINPYFYSSYVTFFTGITSGANNYFPDFRAMSFHQPQDYLVMLLTMAAFLSLGRRRSRNYFHIGLLVLSTILAFHSQRDGWLVTLVSILVIGDAIPQAQEFERASKPAWGRSALGMAVIVVVVLAAAVRSVLPHSREVLIAKLEGNYPVKGCDYIRQNQLPGPLFNAYEWGGFLTWYLPEYPVAVDGRADLYGEEFIIQYSKAMNAEVPYAAFPPFAEARTILLPRKSVMAEALSTLPVFKVAYKDNVAMVLTRDNDALATAARDK